MGQNSSKLLPSSSTYGHTISYSKTRSWFTGIVKTKTHPSHPHKLKLKSYKKPYSCDGCKELGFGPRYRCEKCNFDLHQDCLLATPLAYHDFFENCTFKLHQPPQNCSNNCQPSKRHCDACAKPVRGFVYHCEKNGRNLHPCCRNLPNTLSIENVEFRLSDKVSSKCIFCKKKNRKGTVSGIRGWCYVSECKQYLFHVHCAMEKMLDTWPNGDNNSLATLEKLELPVQCHLSGNQGSGTSKFMKMVKMVFQAIVAIILGDPTTLFTGLVVELVTN